MPSRGPTHLWHGSERSGVGPKPQHSRDEIAATAIDIADLDGLAAVSIRRVAAGIGTGGASLYRYVKSHEELVDLMVDKVSGEYDLGASDESPHIQLLNLARQGRAIMHRHPWLAPLLVTRPALGPNALGYLERALSALEPVEMSGPARLQTIAMLTAITGAFVQHELSSTSSAGTSVGIDGGSLQFLTDGVQLGKYPLLVNALTEWHELEDSDDIFTSVVTNFLTGSGL